jgi:hypothetical protein
MSSGEREAMPSCTTAGKEAIARMPNAAALAQNERPMPKTTRRLYV